MGRGPEQTFFQERPTNGQQIHENVLNITNYQGNVNQSHNEISLTSYLLEWLLSKRQEITSVAEDMEKKETLCIVVGNANCYNYYEKSKILKIILSSKPSFGYISKRNEIRISKRYMYSHVHCNIIHYSQDMETTYMSTHR